MKKSLKQAITRSIGVLLVAQTGYSLAATTPTEGVEFSIRWDSINSLYRVYMRPNATPSPRDLSTTAQVTIVAPYKDATSLFSPSSLTGLHDGVTWSTSSRVYAPSENPTKAYLSFTAKIDLPTAFQWQAGVEQEVFNFKNSSKCLGAVELMNNATDPFNKPDGNSSNTNPGNQFSNTYWGDANDNDYLGNYGSVADCSLSVDTDGDGLLDSVEVNTTKTDPLKADTDGDGLSDGVEVNTTQTDPLKADTDGDTLTDGSEVNTSKTDPLKADTDGDTLSDSTEVNTTKTNPLKADTDGDTLSDATELNTTKTDPLKADTDGDGLNDNTELATTKTDPLKADSDGDTLTDGFEVNTSKTDPLKLDTDGDGLSDSNELNTTKTDPLKADTDGDGLGDGAEITTTKTNPLKLDTDGDGLGDMIELNTTKTDPNKLDTDGDGVNDNLEVGADPLKPLDTDLDGKINALDTDDDNDGVLTASENYNGGTPVDDDTDKDTKPDYLDSDDDGDGKLSATEGNDPNKNGLPDDAVDSDGDGKVDYLDSNDSDGIKGDSDKDGLTNEQEQLIGSLPNDPDSDKDGILDGQEFGTGTKARDTDLDGKIDLLDSDDDNDGLPTANEDNNLDADKNPSTQALDTDSDTIPNYLDKDDDGDGLLTSSENYNSGTPADDDTDKDGKPDYLDKDDDGDGLLSANEGNDPNKNGLPEDALDSDKDGIVDYLDATVDVVTLQVRVMLQGAFNSPTLLMRDDLRVKGYIPTKQPYTVSPYSYTGAELASTTQLAVTGNNAPVDWVLVELRSSANSKTVLQRKAALVQRDGDVVDASTGSTTLSIPEAFPGSYYVAIRHRNHLGVMTASPLSLKASPTLVDFTTANTVTYGNVSGRVVSKGISLLWAGDANMDSNLISNGVGQDTGPLYSLVLSDPANILFSSNFIVNGYSTTDFTMDGQTIFTGPNNDVNLLSSNVLANPGNLSYNANYIVRAQLP